MEQLKTRQQIADEIGVSRKTLYRWLKKWNVKLSSGLLCPNSQKLIKEKIFLEMSQNVPLSPIENLD
jgi:transposase-like protein